MTSWNANGGKAEACSVPAADELLDAIIAIQNIPIEIGASELMIKELYLGFTLRAANTGPEIEALLGGIVTEGQIGAGEIHIFDPQLHAGVGTTEGYLGARAGARFNSIQMSVAFLAGKTCSDEVLVSLDPQAAEFIGPLTSGFNGVFVRGAASMPIFSIGCPFEIGASADVGAWVLAGPPLILGGLVGGALYGEGACIVSVRGQITTLMQAEGDLGNPEKIKFHGEGFVVGGFGFDCDPATWTSVSRSRDDDWCGTGDAKFKADYDGDSFSIKSPKVSILH